MMREKVVIKLAEVENGYWIRGKVMIVVKEASTIEIYKIKKPLKDRELKLLDYNIEVGLRAIGSKLIKGAPLKIIDDAVFYHDMLLLKVEKKVIIANVID